MGIIRCTCIYRPSTTAELDVNHHPITAAVRDPLCPANTAHARADRARARASAIAVAGDI
jgi:hypothetical protein